MTQCMLQKNNMQMLKVARGRYERACILFQPGNILDIWGTANKIHLKSFSIVCGRDPLLSGPGGVPNGTDCRVGQTVGWMTRSASLCPFDRGGMYFYNGSAVPPNATTSTPSSTSLGANDHPKTWVWNQGEVVEVLSEERAVVRIDNGANKKLSADDQSQQQGQNQQHDQHPQQSGVNSTVHPGNRTAKLEVVYAEQVSLVSQLQPGERQTCLRFAARRDPRVGIVVVADANFQIEFSPQLHSLRCYAARNHYDFVTFDRVMFPECEKMKHEKHADSDIFFMKHCIVAEFLRAQPPGYTAVVVDSDNVAVVMDKGLERWLQNPGDVQFYERDAVVEIAAGNYIARNTPFGLRFLMQWSEYVHRQPPGFSSADNGALHAHLISTLRLAGREKCLDMYQNLTDDSMHLDPYMEFVKCARQKLGNPRTWHTGDGKVTIWPQLHFFVADGVSFELQASPLLGPVIHHGVKDRKLVETPYGKESKYYKNLDRCEINEAQLFVPLTGKGFRMLGKGPSRFRGCVQCVPECTRTLSCQPLGNDEEPRPNRTCSDCH